MASVVAEVGAGAEPVAVWGVVELQDGAVELLLLL